MRRRIELDILKWTAAAVVLAFASTALAQDAPSECVELGALAWDDWTSQDGGGNGLPDGATDNDYVRCKACHGWDLRGTGGGYIRRSRNEGRPNAGAGDSDQTSRNIAFTDRGGTTITADMIFHAGTGRSFEDGIGSWVPLDDDHSAENKAAYANGYTLGNQHPDFSTGGANAMTQEQADCLAEFLNFEDAGWDAYFNAIFADAEPIVYLIRQDADADRGESRYNDVCFACHGDPSEVGTPFAIEGQGVLEFLSDTPHFSEFAHKARWGHPDSLMTRDALGDPTSLDVADVMLYLQQLGGTGFAINPGISGTWYDPAHDGEGFLIEVAAGAGAGKTSHLQMVVTYYTYDDMGNQTWLIGVGPPDGNFASIDMVITDGATFGSGFDPNDVNRTPWGTVEFTFDGCSSGNFSAMPNQDQTAFEPVSYPVVRLTSPEIDCP